MGKTGVSLAFAFAFALAGVPRVAEATPPDCGDNVIDDALAGMTLGDQQGGTLDASGFTPTGSTPSGSIVWALDPPLRQGCVEVTVQGLHTTGVGEHDLVELFTGPDGDFNDGNTDFFLLLKIAGDVFPEVLGELKVEMGEELSATEVGTWSDPQSWDAADSHTLAVRLDGNGIAEFYRDDVLLGTVDYGKINGIAGEDLAFESLRIPNNGEYQNQAALEDAVFTDVRVWNHDQGGGGTTTTGGGDDTGDPPGTSGGDEAGDGSTSMPEETTGAPGSTGVDNGEDTGSGTGGGPLPGTRGGGAEGCGCTSRPDGGAGLLLLALFVLGTRLRPLRAR